MSEKAVLSENPAQTPQVNSKPSQTETEVFAVFGAEPEVQAYAMAKYSRSALSMKESLRELNEQKAEKFLNTFYFQYGHRSIADLAHVALAVEKLSLLAAIALVDEQRWDGQERSTRYQNFQKSGYYTPEFGGNQAASELYQDAIGDLFQHYRSLSETVFRFLADRTPKPDDMKQEAYERTLRARAFDITRYLLPLATNTSLGEIVNARTLETQVSRLLSDPHEEIRRLGELLKRAASQPAWNLNQDRYRDLVNRLREKDEALANEAGDLLLKDVRVAPTLVKYAEPNAYQMNARRELSAAAAEIMAGEAVESAKLVDLLEDEPLEIELATTLLYEHCHYPYRQIRRRVEAVGEKRRAEIIDIGIRLRGRHDELLRAYCSGQKFRFDILMDIGGFRDMHRHRRCVQIGQGFTTQHGFDTPDEILAAAAGEEYIQAMQRAAEASAHLRSLLGGGEDAEEKSEYLIPLAYRKRTLFKMDLAEAVYIAELRSKPEGHISYRQVAYAMYEEVVRRHPALAEMFRVRDINEPVDLLKR